MSISDINNKKFCPAATYCYRMDIDCEYRKGVDSAQKEVVCNTDKEGDACNRFRLIPMMEHLRRLDECEISKLKDYQTYNTNLAWEITKIPQGYIYSNSVSSVFVPERIM